MRQGVRPSFSSSLASLAAASVGDGGCGEFAGFGELEGLGCGGVGGLVDDGFDLVGEALFGGALEARSCCGPRWMG